MGLESDYFLTAGDTWSDLLHEDCVKLSIAFERGWAYDGGEQIQIVKVGRLPISDELFLIWRPWGLFLQVHWELYVCSGDLSADEALLEIAKWSESSTDAECLLAQMGAKLWSYKVFRNAGAETLRLLLHNSGWELLPDEENLEAYGEFAKLNGKDVLCRHAISNETTSSGSTFKLPEEELFLTDRDRFWQQEIELRRILTSSFSERSSEVRQVYFLSLNHDGFRFDWSLFGGNRLARLPWPECFLNTSGEIVIFAPEIGEAVYLKGHMHQLISWGKETTKRLCEWLPRSPS